MSFRMQQASVGLLVVVAAVVGIHFYNRSKQRAAEAQAAKTVAAQPTPQSPRQETRSAPAPAPAPRQAPVPQAPRQSQTSTRQVPQSPAKSDRPLKSPPRSPGRDENLENILLNAWDAGRKADIGSMLMAINQRNVNYRTKQNGWTPLMVLAGLNAKGTTTAIRELMQMGGDPAIVDEDGWNALHWAAFHDSLDACKELAKERHLLAARDFEGKTPYEWAKSEGNKEMAQYLKKCLSS